MWIYNGRRLNENVAWSDDYGIQHPANWNVWSEEEKASKGIVWVQQQQRPDERFYYISDNADGTFTSIPKDLSNLVSSYVFACKSQCNSLLRDTDWQVIAFLERQREIPPEVKLFRKLTIDACNELEGLYKTCTTIEDLVSVVNNANSKWPVMQPTGTQVQG